MAENWREPVIPLAVEPALDRGIYLPGGRVLGEAQLVLKQEDIERMRLGYVCAKCLEPQETAWPEHCPVCGSPMKTEQAAYFAREFGGEVLLGRRTRLADELEGLEERRRKEDERARQNGELR